MSKIQVVILSLVLLAGCATYKSHTSNPELLKSNAGKTFEIGTVKVLIPPNFNPLRNDIDEKVRVLNAIPTEAICCTIESAYGIRIDTETDKRIRIISKLHEPSANINPYYRSPYYGKNVYTKPNILKKLLGIYPSLIKSESPVNTVNITYGMELPPFTLNIVCWYAISIKAGDQEIFSHKGMLIKRTIPQKYLIVDTNAVYDVLAEHAAKINAQFSDAILMDKGTPLGN